MHPSTRRARALLATLGVVGTLLTTGCLTREVLDSVYKRNRIEVILVEKKRIGTVIERGLSHPAKISAERLSNILGSIEIRGREDQLAGIRYVFEGSQVKTIGKALQAGFQRATPNQTLAVRLTSKVMQHGIFNRKHLTSFVAYVRDDLLFLHISRVDWRVPDLTKKTDPPLPRVDEHPMKFRVVPGQGMYAEGIYAVSVEWKNPVFAKPLRRASADGKGERTILLEDKTPLDEPRDSGIPTSVIANLTPTELRALADLEEGRQQGTVTEGHYRRQRQKIFDAANARARRPH